MIKKPLVLVKPIAVILLLMCVTCSSAYAATLAKRGAYTLTHHDINNLIRAGEQVAGHAFTSPEKQALQRWAITLFKTDKSLKGVASAFDKYKRYIVLANKQRSHELKQLVWHHLYREMVFKWRFPRYSSNTLTLLDAISRYNPVIWRDNRSQMLIAKKDRWLFQQSGYYLSQPMWTALKVATEYLAKRKLAQQDVNKLYQWMGAAFNNHPQQTLTEYADFLNNVVPMALNRYSHAQQERFRTQTYQRYQLAYQRYPLAQKWQGDFMDIVSRYNPRQLDYLRVMARQKPTKPVANALLMQSMQMNQQVFNQALNAQKQWGETISGAIRDQGQRDAIHISGGRIISSDKYGHTVENAQGERYRVGR